VLAGVVLFPVAGNSARNRELVTKGLLTVLAVIAGYAALRAVIGPAAWERAYSLARSQQAIVGEVSRDVGSFNSPQDLASFLVPAAVFALIVAVLDARVRVLASVTFLLAVVGVVDSYVRVGIVAIAVGAGVLALVVLLARETPRRAKALAVCTVLVVGAGAYAGALAAGGASRITETRAGGLSDPLSDFALQDRWSRWKRGARTALHHPLGTGIGTVGGTTGHAAALGRPATGNYTDNSDLKVLDEQGIAVGLLFIIGALGSAFVLGRRIVRTGPLREPVAIAALGAFVSFLILCVLAEYIEWPGKVLAWTLLGIGLWYAYGSSTDRSGMSGGPTQ
jgi:hypothetical protein